MTESDREAIAKTTIERDGQSMTLMESLVCSYSVEGHLRAEIAKLQRELIAERRRGETLAADLAWLRADATAGGDADDPTASCRPSDPVTEDPTADSRVVLTTRPSDPITEIDP